jgi:hypothetical protein
MARATRAGRPAGRRRSTTDQRHDGQVIGQAVHCHAGQTSDRGLGIVAVGTTKHIAQRILGRCDQALTVPPTDNVRKALHFLLLRKLASQRSSGVRACLPPAWVKQSRNPVRRSNSISRETIGANGSSSVGSPTLAWGSEAPAAVWSDPPTFGGSYKVWHSRVMTAAMWRART